MQKLRDLKQQSQNVEQQVITTVQQTPQHFVEYQQTQFQDQNHQIQFLENKLQQVINENELLRGDLNRSNQKSIQLERNVDQLITEIQRLNQVIISKDNELKNSDKRLKGLEVAYSELQRQGNVVQDTQEVIELRRKVEDYQRQLAQQNTVLVSEESKGHQERIVMLTTEIERLNRALRAKDEEINTIRYSPNKNDEVRIRALQDEVESYKQIVRNLQSKQDNGVTNVVETVKHTAPRVVNTSYKTYTAEEYQALVNSRKADQ